MDQGLFGESLLHGGHQLVAGNGAASGEGDDTAGVHDHGHGEVALTAQGGVVFSVDPVVGILGEEDGVSG